AQNIILAEADLVNARRALENLKVSGTARAQAQLALANAQRAYNDAKQRYDGLGFRRGSAASIEKTEADLKLAENQVANASRLYDALAGLPDDNPDKAQAKSALNAAILNRDRLRATLNYLTGKPSTQDAIEIEARYLLAEAQLADAQREWERLKDGPDPDDIAAAEARIAAIEATLALAKITAPFAGTITQSQPKVGDQVTPGSVAFRIDDLSHLLVDVRVSEIDINSIKVGQPVTLSFDAILNSEYQGVVVAVDPVGTQGAGVIDFAVTVELTNPDSAIRPGMTAAVNILVNELQDVLLVPNRAVRFIEGKRVVYVLRGESPEPVTIILGASSDLNSQVTGGDLKEGDLIVLNPPTTFGRPGGGPFGP
ncbi:MAG: efflux RND transporter periplasmic adaptor subunit, partial [Anaerolineales bacterium]